MNNCDTLFEHSWKVVSSAKSKDKKLFELGRSFMNNKNNNGPRTLPWGTPQSSVCKLDLLLMQSKLVQWTHKNNH